MKKIFTLVLMTLLVSMSAMADMTWGNLSFSLTEGGTIRPSKLINGTGIQVTFPEATGYTLDEVSISGLLMPESGDTIEVQDIFGTFTKGITLNGFTDIQGNMKYTLKITGLMSGENEKSFAEGEEPLLHFTTKSLERKMSWTFTIDEDSHTKIKENADGTADLWSYVSAGTDQRFYACKHSNEPLMLDANTEMPMTEDLTFTFGASKFYVGSTTDTKYQKLIAFNANSLSLTIPDCKKGEVITFNANRATKASSTKFTCIQAQNGCALAPDGLVSTITGLKDSVQLGSSYTNFKFEVQADGDASFTLSNCLLASINIQEAKEKVECTYSVNAVYTPEGGEPVVLKNLVSSAKAMSGTTIKVPYSYWLKDTEGNLYTYGTKGNEFHADFDLESDTTFVINYKSANTSDVLYLSEGEDIEGATACTHANAAIRSSNQKAGYVTTDTKLVTLQPGSYKISAILFDANKTATYSAKIKIGADSVMLNASATNWTEVESQLINITTATDIILAAGGSETQGIDIIAIHSSSDAPDPEISFVNKTMEINGDSIANELTVEGGWDDGKITYKSADTSIATVNATTGKVAGMGLGTTTITATYTYNSGKSKLTATYEVTVKVVDAGINNVAISTEKKSVIKAIKNGKLYIDTKNGTYNAAGALIK